LALALPAQAQQRSDDDDIVVTAERPRGSVPGDVTPEVTFSGAEVRSFGANSIFQVLATLAPLTGSTSIRGGGAPIVLVNGRRISGFQEIRDLPPDVISRVEVFDEQLSLQYGFSPDQRVVNLVLEETYRIDFLEAGAGAADGDARGSARAEAGRVNIDGGDRLALTAAIESASAITEDERGIAPPTTGADERSLRTLAPDTDSWRAGATFARALSPLVTGTTSLRFESNETQSLLGLDASGVRVRDTDTQTWRASAGLDGSWRGWQWTATATGELTQADSRTRDASPSRTESDQTLIDVTANANGALFQLPAGPARGAFRVGVERREIDASGDDRGVLVESALERTAPYARLTLSAPLTSRRREVAAAFGDIALNLTGSWGDPSDFETLASLGLGGSWSPIRSLRLSLQTETSDAAPTLSQLGDPLQTTPDVFYFDPVTGDTVLITRTAGSNDALLAEEREDTTFNANWSPNALQGFTLAFSWAQNNSTNAIVALPTALPETEAAFPSRFTRDLGGALVAVDVRPINLAQRDIETIRWGFNISRPIGARRDAAPNQGGPRGEAERAGLNPGAGSAGRWNVSVFHRLRLNDDAVLGAGQPSIDLLERGGLNGGGEPRNALELAGGVFYRGLGVRVSGNWSDDYSIPVASGGELGFSERLTLNARFFVNFDARPDILERAPYLAGSRLFVSVDNLTDSVVDVRDETGATPSAYQEGYLVPLGRVIQVSFRKQF
jgi:hypothetical protein